jgi:ATP-dependent protease Clp ATPase subunit
MKNQICTFCAKTKLETKFMFQGVDTFICDNCIKLAHELLLKEELSINENEKQLLTRKEISKEEQLE